MDTQQIDEKTVFNAARRLTDAAARQAFVTAACGDDNTAIQRIQELLRVHEQEHSFLESPAVASMASTGPPSITEQPGAVIGPYKLLQQIGEGGMGVVYMAEQSEPIQRTVALKIIKPGMDTRQVIARFEAERQALAMMDHPNIARVIDAGTTETARPYFVMDLVKGVPITEYCDQQHFPVRERLELMATVCQAVQHAHQKGIIHRDLKPSNVLVAEYDGKPVPKIIDFGVAKATAQRLIERTMFTEYGQLIGTFEYMSPEQARFNQLDVDTRSDIYSLGVLLYEVLAGSTPLEKQRLRSAAFDEVLRIICEEEPPVPSLRLSSSQALPSISAQRQIEPAKLKKLVEGELDWVVMKCLDKDRNRRYETASALAEDLQHYLADEPVEARPSTRIYRLKKFVRRNKASVLTGAGMVGTLIAGLILASFGLVQARHQAERADHEATRARAEATRSKRVSQFLTDTFEAAGIGEELGLAEIDKLFSDEFVPNTQSKSENARLLRLRATWLARLGRWEEAAADCLKANDEALDGGQYTFDAAIVLLKAGRHAEYRKTCHAYLEKAGDRPNFIEADMAAKVSLLLPVSGDDFDRACRLADFAATENGPAWHVPFIALGKALAEFRRGRHDSATDWAERSVSNAKTSRRHKAAAYFVQASACAALEKGELAHKAFDSGNEVLGLRRETFTYEFGDNWCDFAIAELLRSEAARQLGISEIPTTPARHPVDIPTPLPHQTPAATPSAEKVK